MISGLFTFDRVVNPGNDQLSCEDCTRTSVTLQRSRSSYSTGADSFYCKQFGRQSPPARLGRMAGLIPLLLKPAAGMSNRTSVAFQPSSHSRQASTGSIPNSRPKAMRRLSQPAPTSLPALPYTVAEWRRAILEIKRLHLNRKYRACSTRCSEILESLRNAVSLLFILSRPGPSLSLRC